MLKTDQFYLKFRWNLLLTFFGGTFIPGMDALLPKNFPKYIFSVSLIALSFNGIDEFVTAFYSKNLEFVMSFILKTCSVMYLGAILESVYMIFRRNELKCLISAWCNFQPTLWPELREIAMSYHMEEIRKMLKNVFLFCLLPCVFFLGINVYKRQLAVWSMLAENYEQVPRWLVLLQCFGVWCWTFRYTMLSCLFSTIFRLILVELDYLESCLQKIFNDVKISTNGSMYRADDEEMKEILPESYKKLSNLAEKRLCELIRYHGRILRFGRLVNEIFGYLFFIQVYFMSTFVAILVFGFTTNVLTIELISLFASGVGVWIYLLFLNCSIGEDVISKSSGFVNAAFYGNWTAYPVRIQKLLVPMIAIATQRPIVVNPFGILPVNRETFNSMISFQYKLFRFILDTQKHKAKAN